MAQRVTVLICGGGNGAHVMAGLANRHDEIETRVLTTFKDEAERWTRILEDDDLLLSIDEGARGPPIEYRSKPHMITKDPAKAVKGVDIVVFALPAFAHKQYLEALEPYIEPNTTIIGLPGQPGFVYQVHDVLKDKAKECVIMSYESLPWACRIEEFGKCVKILMVKVHLMGCIIRGQSKPSYNPVKVLQSIMGEEPKLTQAHCYLEPILSTKSIIHPPIMFGRWKDWDGKPLTEKPLFYQGLDEDQAEHLSGISDELVATAKAISAQRPDVDLSGVQHLYDWYLVDHKPYIKDTTSLLTVMQTDTAYDGLTHPMIETDDGKFVPDFTYRYLREDVPDGLVVTRGIAQIAGVDTPYHDEVIAWCQKKLGKEFLIGDPPQLNGKDIASTRCPQRYGINTMKALVSFK